MNNGKYFIFLNILIFRNINQALFFVLFKQKRSASFEVKIDFEKGIMMGILSVFFLLKKFTLFLKKNFYMKFAAPFRPGYFLTGLFFDCRGDEGMVGENWIRMAIPDSLLATCCILLLELFRFS